MSVNFLTTIWSNPKFVAEIAAGTVLVAVIVYSWWAWLVKK